MVICTAAGVYIKLLFTLQSIQSQMDYKGGCRAPNEMDIYTAAVCNAELHWLFTWQLLAEPNRLYTRLTGAIFYMVADGNAEHWHVPIEMVIYTAAVCNAL